MKCKQPIIKLVSILIIFVLTQKIAGDLYLHNLLHSTKNNAVVAHGSKVISQYNCSCIDDFYAPFTQSVKCSVEHPQFLTISHIVKNEQKIIFRSTLFTSLRGPPAA
ncbi:MAG: hypothetical protein JSS70_04000 [Bacteroidetes bacterium]|nr:hypothetical protein [Bacteroidota bacterium]